MQSKIGFSTAPRWLIACLVLMLSAAACGLPVTGGEATPTPTASGSVETLAATLLPATQPAATQPAATQAAPTQAAPTQANPTAAPTAANTQPAPQPGEVLIHMVALEDAGKSGAQIGCGDSLIPVRRTIEAGDDPLTTALEILFSVKTQFYGESGLYNALYQSNLSVESAAVDASGRATVALVGQYRLGGACDTPRFKAQIEQTILSSSGASSAVILLNGVPIDQALSTQ